MRLLLLVPLLLFSSFSFSESSREYWRVPTYPAALDPLGSCLKRTDRPTTGVHKVNDFNYGCVDSSVGPTWYWGTTTRYLCPINQVFDEAQQKCSEPPQCLAPKQLIPVLQEYDGSIRSECHNQCPRGYQRVELSIECEEINYCPDGFPSGYDCKPPFEDPEGTSPPSCGENEQAINEGTEDMFCVSPDPEYDPNDGLPDPTDPDNPQPKFPDPQPDTGGGDTGGGDSGGSLNCPSGFIESNGVCVSNTDGGLNCPIGTSEGSFENEGTCVPDDCPSGQYMTAGGCSTIPSPTPPSENTDFDSSGIIAAIKDQTFKINRNTTDTAKAGTFSIIQNDNKIARDLSNQITSENDALIGAIGDGSGDIVSALGDVKSAIDGLDVSGGGGDTEPPPVDCGEGSELCPPDDEEEEFTGGVGGTVGTSYASFSEVNQAFFERVSLSEFGQAGANLPVMFQGSGTCPILRIDFPDPISAVIQTDIHCVIWAQISGIITAVMMIIYSFLGFRILFEA